MVSAVLTLPVDHKGLGGLVWLAGAGTDCWSRDRGEAVQSSRRWNFARKLIGVLVVIASADRNRPIDSLREDDQNNPPMTREDVYRRQLDLDVAAIIRGMALAHGAQVVALTPEP